MELTRIGNNNWGVFSPIVFDAYTQNAPEVLRIGAIDEGKVAGAMSIGYRMDLDLVFLDSIFVVPEYRKQGVGRMLLEEALRLVNGKVSCMESEFFGDAEDLKGFFEACGFACIEGEPVFDFDAKKLLSNKQYQRISSNKLKGVIHISFVEMTSGQRHRIFELLQKKGERQSEAGTALFSPELSVGVYRSDDMRVPRAVLLVTQNDKSLTIAQLYGSGKNNPKYILCAIFGFGEALRKAEKGAYEELSTVAAHPGIKGVFELLFGKRLKPTESGLIHAVRFIM